MPISIPIRSISGMAPPPRWSGVSWGMMAHGTLWRGRVALASLSKLDALLGADPLGVQRVLDFPHLRDKVCRLDQRPGCVTARDNQMQHRRLMRREPREHLGSLQPAEVQQIG